MDDHTQMLGGLLGGLDEGFDRKAWHGATLWGTLRTVSAAEAAWRPARDRHNVWKLAVHCAYWKYIVRRRLTGERRRTFPLAGSDWFVRPVEAGDAGGAADAGATAVSATGDAGRESAWDRDRALLREEHGKLRGAVSALSADDLFPRFGGRDRVRLIRGIAAHDVYHTGQIRLLLRLGG